MPLFDADDRLLLCHFFLFDLNPSFAPLEFFYLNSSIICFMILLRRTFPLTSLFLHSLFKHPKDKSLQLYISHLKLENVLFYVLSSIETCMCFGASNNDIVAANIIADTATGVTATTVYAFADIPAAAIIVYIAIV